MISGEFSTDIVPVFDGFALPHISRRLPVAGTRELHSETEVVELPRISENCSYSVMDRLIWKTLKS